MIMNETIKTEPTQIEKEQSIEIILSKGLKKPRSIWSLFREMHQLLGFRFIFWDTALAFVLSSVVLIAVVFPLIFAPKALSCTILFACSPLLFLIVLFFSEMIEITGSLYELKLTCKYSIRQITAYRIMCFSLLGLIFCIGMTAHQSENIYELLHLFALSLCSFFLCAFVSLFFIRCFARKARFAFAISLWFGILCLPALFFGKKWELFLSELPVAVSLGVAILCAVLFLFEIRKFVTANPKEEMTYVTR
ncbi:hypothetical protein FACS1894111_09090 [Clostridia bacterium]|nr:hypothetical protein FACS1894111_09090 [Clostridia bacterium]